MNVEFSSKFYKDLDSISSKTIRTRLKDLIEKLEEIDSLNEIPNLKRLSGHKSAYRIRFGDYRLGFFLKNQTIIFARILHRKKIYLFFP